MTAPANPVPFDGRYDGLGTLQSGDALSCGSQLDFTLRVTGNAFTYVLLQPQIDYRPSVTLSAVIGPNGSASAIVGTDSLVATFGGGHMQGVLTGDACAYAIEADRNATW